MRTLNQILIANQENQPVTADEYRVALEAMRYIEHFLREDLKKLIDAVNTDKPSAKMRAKFSEGTMERMFAVGKKPPDEWLGPNNIPGSVAQVERLAWAKRLFEKVTGEKLRSTTNDVRRGDVLRITGDGVYGWGDRGDIVRVTRIDSQVVVCENSVGTKCTFRREFGGDEFEPTDECWTAR